MKHIIFFLLFLIFSCKSTNTSKSNDKTVKDFIDSWHQAASDAKFEDYFSKMHDSSIFIGTDATENWDKPAFMAYAKPHFDKGKAWKFKVLERNLFYNKDKNIVWFDELLDTSMKICRGSGVLVFENNQWYIKHYVLSMTIPNDNADTVVEIKKELEDKVIKELKNKK